MEEQINRIKKYIIDNYEPEDGARTSFRGWEDNDSDEAFNDGVACGTACELFTIGRMLGLDLEEIHTPDEQ